MNKMIRHKLKTLLWFQERFPTSHVGGSIGLMIRGIDLKRGLNSSDLDITTDNFDSEKIEDLEDRSDGNDFDYAFKVEHKDGFYTKIDIRIDSESSFDVIEFEGIKYNVSKLDDILWWKKNYADKGVKKHEYDLVVINTGIRPVEPPDVNDDDDLPF